MGEGRLGSGLEVRNIEREEGIGRGISHKGDGRPGLFQGREMAREGPVQRPFEIRTRPEGQKPAHDGGVQILERPQKAHQITILFILVANRQKSRTYILLTQRRLLDPPA